MHPGPPRSRASASKSEWRREPTCTFLRRCRLSARAACMLSLSDPQPATFICKSAALRLKEEATTAHLRNSRRYWGSGAERRALRSENFCVSLLAFAVTSTLGVQAVGSSEPVIATHPTSLNATKSQHAAEASQALYVERGCLDDAPVDLASCR